MIKEINSEKIKKNSIGVVNYFMNSEFKWITFLIILPLMIIHIFLGSKQITLIKLFLHKSCILFMAQLMLLRLEFLLLYSFKKMKIFKIL